MRKIFLFVLAMAFSSSILFAADAGVKVNEETKNKGEATKLETKERTRERKETKEMKKEMKKELKEHKKEKKEMKGTR